MVASLRAAECLSQPAGFLPGAGVVNARKGEDPEVVLGQREGPRAGAERETHLDLGVALLIRACVEEVL